MRTIAIKRTDGGISIMRVFDDNADVATEIAKWQASSGDLVAVSFHEIQDQDVPADRTDRDSWEWQA